METGMSKVMSNLFLSTKDLPIQINVVGIDGAAEGDGDHLGHL